MSDENRHVGEKENKSARAPPSAGLGARSSLSVIALPEAISRLMPSSRAATVTARVACPKDHGKKAFYAYHNKVKEQGEGGWRNLRLRCGGRRRRARLWG